MKHLMIDMETLDNRPSSAVLEVGIAVFTKDQILGTQGWILDVDEQTMQHRTVSIDTLAWWMNQSSAAKALFDRCKDRSKTIKLQQFLSDFSALYAANGIERIWSNGADFDISILADMYRSTLTEPPWKFWDSRCYRTINKSIGPDPEGARHPGVKHEAVGDAVYQAIRTMRYLQTNPAI